MATKVLSLYKHLLSYQKQNLRSLSYFLRFFSSQKSDSSELSEQKQQNPSKDPEPVSKWLNIRAGILGPEDERLPFPGDIGLSYDLRIYFRNCAETSENFEALKLPSSSGDLVDTNHLFTEKEQDIIDMRETHEMYKEVFSHLNGNVDDEIKLACRVQKCPDLLKKDFSILFPDENISNQELIVMTLCQKTENDMSSWSEELEAEREELISQFSERAQKMCDKLIEQGYWADFIDPSSGRPSLGSFTNSTFFETDERYRYFGFNIEDLGCCKIISHRVWGAHIFVGAIFSNAPMYSDAVEDALDYLRDKTKS